MSGSQERRLKRNEQNEPLVEAKEVTMLYVKCHPFYFLFWARECISIQASLSLFQLPPLGRCNGLKVEKLRSTLICLLVKESGIHGALKMITIPSPWPPNSEVSQSSAVLWLKDGSSTCQASTGERILLESVVLSEANQAQKDKRHEFSLMGGTLI